MTTKTEVTDERGALGESKAKHTPGPWRVEFSRWSAEEKPVGFAVYPTNKTHYASDHDFVGGKLIDSDIKPHSLASANFSENIAFGAFYSAEEIEANARLIAAAPTLLDLVLLFEKSVEFEINRDQDREGRRMKTLTLGMIREALAAVQS